MSKTSRKLARPETRVVVDISPRAHHVTTYTGSDDVIHKTQTNQDGGHSNNYSVNMYKDVPPLTDMVDVQDSLKIDFSHENKYRYVNGGSGIVDTEFEIFTPIRYDINVSTCSDSDTGTLPEAVLDEPIDKHLNDINGECIQVVFDNTDDVIFNSKVNLKSVELQNNKHFPLVYDNACDVSVVPHNDDHDGMSDVGLYDDDMGNCDVPLLDDEFYINDARRGERDFKHYDIVNIEHLDALDDVYNCDRISWMAIVGQSQIHPHANPFPH